MRRWIVTVIVAASMLVSFVVPASSPAGAVVAGTYATKVGIAPRDGSCSGSPPSVLAARMQELVTLGVSFFRCDLNWWEVQPNGPTDWQWSQYDDLVNAAHAAHLNILFVLAYTPPWARPVPLPPGTGNPSHVPPARVSDYVNFVTAATNRYAPTGHARPAGLSGSVSMWEIWNEPNITGFWNPPDANRYSTFVIQAATAIRRIAPTATILSGGLVPARSINGNVPADLFLAMMGAAGALSTIDGVGFHPYSAPLAPNQACCNNPIAVLTPRLHAIMTFFGWGSKKIWATETGWPTASQSPLTVRYDGTQVGTEAYQAIELPLLLQTWFSMPYTGGLVLYEQRDECTDNTNKWCKMGLERLDGSHKPAYGVVQAKLTRPLGS